MRKLWVLGFIVVAGCDSYLDTANYSPYAGVSSYTGFSSHFAKTTGTSNFTHEYKGPPVLDSNDALAKFEFEKNAKDYLDGVVNDLEEVNDKADNANDRISAVVDAVNSGFGIFHIRYVGSVLILSRETNFGFVLGYPEFPAFDHSPPLTKPYKPLFFDNEFMVESYNAEVRDYNRGVADFNATVKAYIEDAEHYIENGKNDHGEIRQKGLKLLSYIESLGLDAKVDL